MHVSRTNIFYRELAVKEHSKILCLSDVFFMVCHSYVSVCWWIKYILTGMFVIVTVGQRSACSFCNKSVAYIDCLKKKFSIY